jgi:murein DD-endopeptidase MepM/ murein hydrolase activator NlpD
MERDRNRAWTVQLIPGRGGPTRTWHISDRRMRLARVAFFLALPLIGFGAVTWGYMAVQTWRAAQMAEELRELRSEREAIGELAAALAEVEAGYERLRSLFAPEAVPGAGGLQLPPAGGRQSGAVRGAEEGEPPGTWPLGARGFLTQPLVEGAARDHPGIDIAVPTGTYIRASGSGRIVEAADDPIYGLHILLEHGGGYRSLYAHASKLLVEPGDLVRAGEVIGLTGSTGRSTAPHLHFEILRDGEPIDPLTLVRQP